MAKIYAFVLGVAVGFGLYHTAISYHVVHASDGLHLVPKVSGKLAEAYVDIRGFTAADALEHPALGAAIAASGNAQLQREFAGNIAADVLGEGLGEGVGRALDLLQPRP
ncbi:MAG: hypothetical protein AAF790_04205 [Planctomycetota bacterium]